MEFQIDPNSKELIDKLLKDYNEPALLIYSEIENACITPENLKLELMLMEHDILTDFDKLEKFTPEDIPFVIYVDKSLLPLMPSVLKIGAKEYSDGIGLIQIK